eukprot:CAMPEP_0116909768 /NCGR_PEP_ID=MMETSP0467-20121206/14472_1 /TAXON_ID=283647 /ORGANISM="Mesodinium pulex, Strain SPMC105" /LENGTH=124 /DNA_ID=CAMNT_0004585189 /DNA_START=1036 /DNA_END=1409 /DNA_ORIENTATION=-
MVSSDGNWYDTSVSMLNFINECYKGEIEQESFKVALVNFQFKTYFDELNDVLKLGKNKLDNSEKMNKANISDVKQFADFERKTADELEGKEFGARGAIQRHHCQVPRIGAGQQPEDPGPQPQNK